IVLNLNHYKDVGHYGPEINRWMARAIRDRTHLLTPERIDTYQRRRLEFIKQVIEDARAGRLEISGGAELPVPAS
ncbi:MAG: hypothetical protein CBC35_00270, partial [Planctomycetes bacterium TMED75]